MERRLWTERFCLILYMIFSLSGRSTAKEAFACFNAIYSNLLNDTLTCEGDRVIEIEDISAARSNLFQCDPDPPAGCDYQQVNTTEDYYIYLNSNCSGQVSCHLSSSVQFSDYRFSPCGDVLVTLRSMVRVNYTCINISDSTLSLLESTTAREVTATANIPGVTTSADSATTSSNLTEPATTTSNLTEPATTTSNLTEPVTTTRNLTEPVITTSNNADSTTTANSPKAVTSAEATTRRTLDPTAPTSESEVTTDDSDSTTTANNWKAQQDCSAPPIKNNNTVITSLALGVGESVQYACVEGADQIEGDSRLYCTLNNENMTEWSGSPLTCSEKKVSWMLIAIIGLGCILLLIAVLVILLIIYAIRLKRLGNLNEKEPKMSAGVGEYAVMSPTETVPAADAGEYAVMSPAETVPAAGENVYVDMDPAEAVPDNANTQDTEIYETPVTIQARRPPEVAYANLRGDEEYEMMSCEIAEPHYTDAYVYDAI